MSGELRGGSQVLEETQDREEIIERVAALDIGKAELTCCVRTRPERRIPAPGRLNVYREGVRDPPAARRQTPCGWP